MKRLLTIASTAPPSAGVQFRKSPYGSKGTRQFLIDVLAMANANVRGCRYIFVGIDFDRQGNRLLHKVADVDFSGKPSYVSLTTEFIEPPVRISYRSLSLEDKQLGVYEIGDCQDRPYMMRADQSESLRRGDAYIRVNDSAVKMGRGQLQDLFERKFRDSVSSDRIEIGFPGEIIHKSLRLPTVDLAQLPSAVASGKLKQLIEIRSNTRGTGSTTAVTRLTHARLFGAENPYEDKTPTTLMQEKSQLRQQHHDDDQHFLFEANGSTLQLVVYNQGEESIQDASLSLVLPNHEAFHVAAGPPASRNTNPLLDQLPTGPMGYPSVKLKDDSILVAGNLGDVPSGEPVEVFGLPLRLCAGSELRGRRIGIRYSLFGRNLREPARGSLRLLF